MPEHTSIIERLHRDHDSARALLDRLDATGAADMAEYFCEVRETLVRHEVAEELVLYPAFCAHVHDAEPVASSCIEEQAQAEEMLAAMEQMDESSPHFRECFVSLRQAVVDHAQHEERDVFRALDDALGRHELIDLGDRYDKAIELAPTHPHPHAPNTPPGNLVAMPLAALVDRVRDAMRLAS